MKWNLNHFFLSNPDVLGLCILMNNTRRTLISPLLATHYCTFNFSISSMNWIKSNLPSGLKLATSYKSLPNSLITLFIKGGSRYEDKHTQGYSHLLEHLFLNNSAFNKVKVDGYTTKEIIALKFVQPQKQTLNTLKSIKQILDQKNFAKNFTQKMIDQEKQVIEDEIVEIENDEYETSVEKCHEKLQSSYKYPILGDSKSKQKFNIETLKSFYKKIMQPYNIAIIVQSNLDDEKIKENILEYKHSENKITKGFTNYKFVKYFLLQEIMNLNGDCAHYLPYKSFGIFRIITKRPNLQITDDMLEKGKKILVDKVNNRASSSDDVIDDLGYSLLHFDKILNYDSIVKIIKDIKLNDMKVLTDHLIK